MMLGKRPRPPMKRTTSMTEITFDLNSNSQAPPPKMCFGSGGGGGGSPQIQSGGGLEVSDQRLLSTVSPRNRRYSGDFTEETAHFLRSCCLCKRRLVPGRDIYMYRGNSGFCSKECRQQQMNEDEKKDKCSLVSKKEGASSTTGSKAETVTAL